MDSRTSSRVRTARSWTMQQKKSRDDHFEAYLPNYVNVMPLCLPRCRAFLPGVDPSPRVALIQVRNPDLSIVI